MSSSVPASCVISNIHFFAFSYLTLSICKSIESNFLSRCSLNDEAIRLSKPWARVSTLSSFPMLRCIVS
ncbi:ORF990 [White spot syndrome virus]|uniref:ORF990 n=1 Tax=White spot syndrome virus TaxID=342409 RepID=A0A2D3I6P9_9VIRU|nr:ORF990 [White spot syndrome virus]